MKIVKSPIRLYANPKAVITQFLQLPGNGRMDNIIKRVAALTETAVAKLFEKLMDDFGSRHRDITKIIADNFDKIFVNDKNKLEHFSTKKRLLLGKLFFTKEYSIQSAALFNPSIVPHPDQHGLHPGEQRFIMSLRAVGEGHISSVAFQTGIVNESGEIKLDASSPYVTSLKKNEDALYNKEFINRSTANTDFRKVILDILPDTFTASQAINSINNEFSSNKFLQPSIERLKQILDSNYELQPSEELPFNERIIFPNAKAECMGMEDVRFVRFTEDGKTWYYGSYTAYDGKNIKSQLIITEDFNVFKICTMYGNAISDKGMALLPEKINGKYVMISRQGGEKINIMYSDNLYKWDEYQVLLEPEYGWELVQLGNCGSPVKTDRGWLLLTHGVGVMRTYVISALLLDLNDPSLILARLDKPLIVADELEREGYVPNVVYTCGMLKHGEYLIIPYAVSDSAIGFVTVQLNELLNEMNFKNN